MIISSMWTQEEMHPLIVKCIESFTRFNYPFKLYCYKKLKTVPNGVEVLDANEILPISEFHQYSYKESSISNFSDWFRWKLLAKNPNYIWTDTDIFLIKPLPKITEYLTYNYIGFLKSPNKEMWELFAKFAENPSTKLPFNYNFTGSSRYEMPWGFAGPALMTAYLKHFNYKGDKLKWFYPIPYVNWKYVFFFKN